MSPRGAKIARVTVGRTERGALSRIDRITIYSYKSLSDTYEKIGAFPFGAEGAPQKLFVTDSGRYIVCVNVEAEPGLAGVRVYSLDGKVAAEWPLSKIFTDADVARLPRSTMTIIWATWCDLVGDDRFQISGKLNGAEWGYGVIIDLKTLSLRVSR